MGPQKGIRLHDRRPQGAFTWGGGLAKAISRNGVNGIGGWRLTVKVAASAGWEMIPPNPNKKTARMIAKR